VLILMVVATGGDGDSMLRAAPIDRKAVVRRHIVRIHGDGEGKLGQEPPAVLPQHSNCDHLEGDWYYAYDKLKLRPITVVPAAETQQCPPGNVSRRFAATIAGLAPCSGPYGTLPCHDPELSPAPLPVALCSYSNGSLWLNRSEGACDPAHPADCPTHQTATLNASTCGALNWTDYLPAPALRTTVAARDEICSLAGTWYYQFDLQKERPITVTTASASTACPDGAITTQFTATIANGSHTRQPWYADGPTAVTLCSYSNGSLWLNKSEGACEPTHPLDCPNPRYQTSLMNTSACSSLRWTDHPLLPHWCVRTDFTKKKTCTLPAAAAGCTVC
jgi:hypothetical protein